MIERLRQAAARKERFALWTHLFEPHSSYMTHKEFPTSLSGVPGLKEKYDYEIAFVDIVGRQADRRARASSAWPTTPRSSIMADHGEAWGEHKVYFHGQDLFDEQLRVPLIIAVPGRKPQVIDERGRRWSTSAPTLLDLVGAPIPATCAGAACCRASSAARPRRPPAPRPLFAELLPATAWPHHATMMIDGNHKLIHRISDRRWELYDLARDPGEKKNLADARGDRQRWWRGCETKLLAFEERAR